MTSIRQRKKRWWHLLIGIPLSWFVRSAPSMTDDPREQAYRLEHFRESTRTNLTILRLCWSQVFAWRREPAAQKEQERSLLFYTMHHPMAETRQFIEWKRRGPRNPPPGVRRTLDELGEVAEEAMRSYGEKPAA